VCVVDGFALDACAALNRARISSTNRVLPAKRAAAQP
jgi:hypothetical protein